MERTGSEMRLVRRLEAEKSCRLLGASYHYVGFSDFGLFNNDEGNRRTAALIRDVDPWLVITHPPEDYMSDHEITSRLVRNASFVAPAPNYDTSSYSPIKRSSGIPYLYYAQPAENKDIYGKPVYPSFYVDVGDKMDSKEELLACHESQRDWLRSHHGMDEYLESMRRWNAELGEFASQNCESDIAHAEGYRQHLGHSYPQDNILVELLGNRIVTESRWE
jgi:LmbE family N-acetylglucosaminyl deacetylase